MCDGAVILADADSADDEIDFQCNCSSLAHSSILLYCLILSVELSLFKEEKKTDVCSCDLLQQ